MPRKAREAGRQWNELIDNLPCVVFLSRFASPGALPTYSFIGAGAERVLGVSAAEILEDPLARFRTVHPEDLAALQEGIRAAGACATHWHSEFRVSVNDEIRWVEVYALFYRSPGTPTMANGYWIDVTERFEAEHRHRLWSRVFEGSSEGILICDAEQRIVLVNQAFQTITGITAEEAIGKTPRILQSGRQGDTFYAQLWHSIAETGGWQGEICNRRKNGELYTQWLSIHTIRDRDGSVLQYVGIFSDITQRKQTEARLFQLAHFDSLTNLPNRLLFADRLGQLVKAAQREKANVAVLLIDLDRFKDVNESVGHDAGDRLLKEVARRFSSVVRAADSLARSSGDEYLLAIPAIEQARDAAVVAEKLLAVLADPIVLDGHEITVTASIGIAVFPDDGEAPSDLLRNIEAALYRAKAAGRNMYRFYARQMNASALHVLALENGLRRAVERHELVLYYQPQVDACSRALVGVEALIRWNHPEQGLLPPAAFIHIAEERGLITAIGDWVIGEAARQLADWRERGLPELSVAVNLSALQFHQPGFVQRVFSIAERYAIPPDCLELELTESIIMHDAEGTINAMRALHERGFRLSIDDFGTGYSSLSYLRRFPIDKIKIDRSFVTNIAHRTDDASIVSAIIGLAKSLHLKVVAEGVETEDQLSALCAIRCDEAQGFLFARPMPAQDFEALWRSWPKRT